MPKEGRNPHLRGQARKRDNGMQQDLPILAPIECSNLQYAIWTFNAVAYLLHRVHQTAPHSEVESRLCEALVLYAQEVNRDRTGTARSSRPARHDSEVKKVCAFWTCRVSNQERRS